MIAPPFDSLGPVVGAPPPGCRLAIGTYPCGVAIIPGGGAFFFGSGALPFIVVGAAVELCTESLCGNGEPAPVVAGEGRAPPGKLRAIGATPLGGTIGDMPSLVWAP